MVWKLRKFLGEHKNAVRFGVIWLVILAVRFSWYYTHTAAVIYPDSYDYFAYDPLQALQLHAVNGRPPVYGMFLYIVRAVAGDANAANAAAFLQKLIALLVLPVLSATLRRLGVGSGWRSVFLLLYGACPAVYGWDNCILTESLSLSATVVFFFLIVRYIQEKSLRDGVGALVVTVLLIFLRPQFLVYLAMLLVFFVWRMFGADKAEKRQLRAHYWRCLRRRCAASLLTVWHFKASLGYSR